MGRLQTGARPIKRAMIEVEWEGYDDTDTAVEGSIEQIVDGLQTSLWPLGVNPTVRVTYE